MAKGLTALPSKVLLPSGQEIILDDLQHTERSKIQSYICKNISNQLSNYYSIHHNEWENFILNMS